jgi:predicted nucleotidyltransferase
MDREHVLAVLRAHQSELKKAGVLHLSLFGSTVRNQASPDSDVDLLAIFDGTRRLSTLDVVGIEMKLTAILGRPVDLSEAGTLKPRASAQVESEAELAF